MHKRQTNAGVTAITSLSYRSPCAYIFFCPGNNISSRNYQTIRHLNCIPNTTDKSSSKTCPPSCTQKCKIRSRWPSGLPREFSSSFSLLYGNHDNHSDTGGRLLVRGSRVVTVSWRMVLGGRGGYWKLCIWVVAILRMFIQIPSPSTYPIRSFFPLFSPCIYTIQQVDVRQNIDSFFSAGSRAEILYAHASLHSHSELNSSFLPHRSDQRTSQRQTQPLENSQEPASRMFLTRILPLRSRGACVVRASSPLTSNKEEETKRHEVRSAGGGSWRWRASEGCSVVGYERDARRAWR